MPLPPLNPINRMAQALNEPDPPESKTQKTTYADRLAQACAMGKAKA